MKARPYNSSKFALVLILGAMFSQAFAQPLDNGKSAGAQAKKGKAASSFAVKVSGHGDPMILIPGLSSSGDTWTTTAAHFQNRYTCHVLTLAGFAGEPPIDGHGLLLSTVADDLAAYIEQHHLEKPVIVGHSLGGTIALDLAARHASLVGPVVIVDSLPFMAGAWFQVKTAEAAKPMIDQMRSYMASQTREQYEQFVRSGTATKYMVTSPADLQVITQWGLASDRETVTNAMLDLLARDLRADLGHIASPVLVLGTWTGLRDQMEPNGIKITQEQIAATFQEHIPGYRISISRWPIKQGTLSCGTILNGSSNSSIVFWPTLQRQHRRGASQVSEL